MKKTVAMMFDFDNTLAPDNMHEHSFLSKTLKMSKTEFYDKMNELTFKYDLDYVLQMMLALIIIPHEKGITMTREKFKEIGKDIPLYEGVETFFSRIKNYGSSLGLDVKCFIVSSGYKEILEGTKVAEFVDGIFASEFCYDKDGQPFWPRIVMNYSNKVQFITRIRKGLLSPLSNIIEPNQSNKKVIPYKNMIYFGDGETDIPCMKIMRLYGGMAVCVYDSDEKKSMAKKLLKEKRTTLIAEADYREGKEIDKLIKEKLKKIANK